MADNLVEPKLVVVGLGDMRISSDPGVKLITYALGSCIGISAYDPRIILGGLLHYQLPNPAKQQRFEKRPFLYGCYAIPTFFRRLIQKGACKRRLIVKIAGGADKYDLEGILRVGEKNIEIARKLLGKNNIAIAASDTGGEHGRTMSLAIEAGVTEITTPSGETRIL